MDNLLRQRCIVIIGAFVVCLTTLSPVIAQMKGEGTWKVSNRTFSLLKEVNALSAGKAYIDLTVTTHEDLAWINSIEKCKIDRDTLWLTPYINRLRQSPDFQMDVEQSSIIMEYIQRHPEAKDTLTKYMKEGRLLAGASYTQVYEEMYAGESLARQFYLGKKWLSDHFGGYHSNVYYNSDVPGRSLQMPQLMAKAGVDGMFFSRFGLGLYNWKSPDGSYVTAYSPGHYIDFYNILAKTDTAAIGSMAEEVIYWLKNFNNKSGVEKVIPAVLNYEFGWNQAPVHNMDAFTATWNAISVVESETGERMQVVLPTFRFATFDKFIKGIKASSDIPSIMGERPNVWIYIHGPSHHWALSASRQGDVLLPAAEKFWAANRMIDTGCAYPENELSDAWASKIYPDHGWGGKEGQSTDDIFLAKYSYAKEKAGGLLNRAMERLASKVATGTAKGTPLIVFNSLGWQRTDPVSFELPPSLKGRTVRILNAAGKLMSSQLSWTTTETGRTRPMVTFVAVDVPSMGYDTYYLVGGEDKEPVSGNLRADDRYENSFYAVRLGKGGITSLIDKATGKEIIDSKGGGKGLCAGEVFTMESVGNGAGEFDAVQQPSMNGFDRTGHYDTHWTMTQDGPLYTVFHIRQPIRNAVVEEDITLYKTIKRIDFSVALKNWEGVLYREYRMALPLNIPDARVRYEVPFGQVEIGKDELKQPAGQIYQTLPKNIHPRGLQNWMSASGGDFGVTLSSPVAAFDFLDVTGLAPGATVLQPILLASRKSCHGEGNEYLQTGDHYYSFSLTSYAPGQDKSTRFGQQANEPLAVVIGPEKALGVSLPEKGSFVSVDKENVIITAMKKAEDDDGTIVRFYETAGKDSDVEFRFKRAIRKAYVTSLIESNPREIASSGNLLKFSLTHNSIETIKIYWQ